MNRLMISLHNLQDMWLLIHAGIIVEGTMGTDKMIDMLESSIMGMHLFPVKSSAIPVFPIDFSITFTSRFNALKWHVYILHTLFMR